MYTYFKKTAKDDYIDFMLKSNGVCLLVSFSLVDFYCLRNNGRQLPGHRWFESMLKCLYQAEITEAGYTTVAFDSLWYYIHCGIIFIPKMFSSRCINSR